MYCIKCGAKLISKAKYCIKCGAEAYSSSEKDDVQIKELQIFESIEEAMRDDDITNDRMTYKSDESGKIPSQSYPTGRWEEIARQVSEFWKDGRGPAIVVVGTIILIMLFPMIINGISRNHRETIWVCTESLGEESGYQRNAEYDRKGNLIYCEVVCEDWDGDGEEEVLRSAEYSYDFAGYLSECVNMDDRKLIIEREGLRFTLHYQGDDMEYIREFDEKGRLIFKKDDYNNLRYAYENLSNEEVMLRLYDLDRNYELLEEVRYKYQDNLLTEIEDNVYYEEMYYTSDFEYDQKDRLTRIETVYIDEEGETITDVLTNTYRGDSKISEWDFMKYGVEEVAYELDRHGNIIYAKKDVGYLLNGENAYSYKYEKRKVPIIINKINTTLIDEFFTYESINDSQDYYEMEMYTADHSLSYYRGFGR